MSIHVSSWAWKQQVGDAGTKLVLVKLADNADEDGSSRWSQKRLGTECEMARGTLQKKLDKLVVLQLLAVEPRFRDNGSQLPNGYRILMPPVPSSEAPPSPDLRHLASLEPSVEPPPSEKTPSSPQDGDADVQTIYDCWRSERGKANARYATMSPNRKQKIKARLKEYSVEELLRAIRGVANDPWEGRAQHDDLTVIFRSQEQVDKFLALGENGSADGHDEEAWQAMKGKPGEQV